LGAMYRYEVTGDDAHVRDMIMAGVKLEIFCSLGYYGDECTEHCPQGCTHGTCSNGTCSNCEYPYHGEGCNQCGMIGDCVNGSCSAIDGDITASRCVCNREWEGAHCDELVNNCTIVPCSPRGKMRRRTAKCVCMDSRFEGNFCEVFF
ncbi:hypothetical protein PENTCL1PPCAC_29725, partial [Pristionchus entomophagus]